jgi:hypothetical protein
MKRMATKQPSHAHPAAAHRAVALDRFAGIFGTSRNKSARRRQPWRDYGFVELQERNKNDAHELLFDKLQFVAAALRVAPQRQTEVCRTSLTAATLSFAYLGDDVAELTEARAFVCSEQRSFRIQNPVILSLQPRHLRRAAAKQLAQQTLGSITVDRFSNRFG